MSDCDVIDITTETPAVKPSTHGWKFFVEEINNTKPQSG